jgi:hypothetical protein
METGRDGKVEIAEEALSRAAGFACRCGDSALYLKCLVALSNVYSGMGNTFHHERIMHKIQEVSNYFGLSRGRPDGGPWASAEEFRQAAMRYRRKLLLGEVILLLALQIPIGFLAYKVASTPREAAWCIVTSFLAGIGIKLWNVIKVRRVPAIERA